MVNKLTIKNGYSGILVEQNNINQIATIVVVVYVLNKIKILDNIKK